MVLVLLSNTIDTSQITLLTPHLKGLPQVQEVKTIKKPNKEKKVLILPLTSLQVHLKDLP